VHLFLLKQVYKPNSVRLRASIIYLVAASRRQSICLPSNPDSCKPIERATLPATKAKAGIHGISTHKVYSRYILLCSPWALTPHFHPYRCCQRRLFSVTLSISACAKSSRYLVCRAALFGLSSPNLSVGSDRATCFISSQI
jgi:hypothetical protein